MIYLFSLIASRLKFGRNVDYTLKKQYSILFDWYICDVFYFYPFQFQISPIIKLQVYIQHKIEEDKKKVAKYLLKSGGHFYLCGPTWPVPDVKAAIVKGIADEYGEDPTAVDDFIDVLKEEGRYVLEVY